MTSPRRRHGDDAVFCAQLAAGATLRAACAAAGISERTGRRRRSEPEIVDTIERLSDERSAAVTASLVGLGRRAVEFLGELLDSPDVATGTRVRAAQTVLGMTLQYQRNSVERRLVALEEARWEQARIAAQFAEILGDER
jgi:hypothetical protein